MGDEEYTLSIAEPEGEGSVVTRPTPLSEVGEPETLNDGGSDS